jgi:hypothetical protein
VRAKLVEYTVNVIDRLIMQRSQRKEGKSRLPRSIVAFGEMVTRENLEWEMYVW